MQRYVNQLLADIETATRHAPASSSYSFLQHPFDDEDGSNDRAHYTRLLKLGDHTGVPAEMFPPVERLKNNHVKDLLTALEGLWQAWRVHWHCPNGLRARKRYTVMVAWMDRSDVAYHVDLGASIDFCADRESQGCPFGEEGSCKCAINEAQQREIENWQPPGMEPDKPMSPSEELNQWLQGDKMPYLPWMEEDDQERYDKFMTEEDMLTWLYFYRPHWNGGMPPDESHDDPSDYEDFDWRDDVEDVDLPF
ncbi:MAG: hypothetical protein IT270_09060 [Saprospiraceae bacterium]|nr:hypothetical protein [Saprospiraceae bacterium]